MDTIHSAKPKFVNSQHFSTEQFPEVIGFCDRDNASHMRNADEETYQYKRNNKTIYTAKKKGNRWEIIEFDGSAIVRVSTGGKLGFVLFHALSFHESDRLKQEK